MGKHYPQYPGDVQDGDEPSFSPNKTHKSILGVERGTDSTRRLETDSAGNVYVNIAAGTVTAAPTPVITSAVTRVPSSTSSQILIAANANRKGLLFYNDSTIDQYIKFGTVASTIDFSVRLTSHSLYEVQTPVYDGRIDVISSSASGAIQVTELS